MDEEILEFLIRVEAASQETGRTIKELMDATGRNLETVVVHTKMLLRDRKVQVSNADMLSRNAQHVWPAVGHGRMEVTGEELAQAQREWKEQNLYPIITWLGPLVIQELAEKRKADETRELLREVLARPQSIGNQFLGDATNVTMGPVVQGSSLTFNEPPTSIAVNTATNTATTSGWLTKSTAIMLAVGVVGGLLVLIFWEQIKQYF